MKDKFDIIIVGAGAAGYFAAIRSAELNPDLRIGILNRQLKCSQKFGSPGAVVVTLRMLVGIQPN